MLCYKLPMVSGEIEQLGNPSKDEIWRSPALDKTNKRLKHHGVEADSARTFLDNIHYLQAHVFPRITGKDLPMGVSLKVRPENPLKMTLIMPKPSGNVTNEEREIMQEDVLAKLPASQVLASAFMMRRMYEALEKPDVPDNLGVDLAFVDLEPGDSFISLAKQLNAAEKSEFLGVHTFDVETEFGRWFKDGAFENWLDAQPPILEGDTPRSQMDFPRQMRLRELLYMLENPPYM